ncbi:hypothetical protein LOTGIDRAFT_170317 [Lottia gigantea]|uniref:Uncharacterized protein n=1 Tax=Lottia gigantea TaxID=225164 RepID=V3YVY7_LOTGI|nr:hypothetical protein LOTGIDRAFT_170317 [Lottia gigantea]ESO82168.1 hypothetical protein LOTGIDRAFT_170317 [Lottia gigantea]
MDFGPTGSYLLKLTNFAFFQNPNFDASPRPNQLRSGCSIVVFTFELIHHGWIPFLFSVSSIEARLQLRTTWLDMVCNLGFWRCIQIEFHYIRIKCLWCGMEAPRTLDRSKEKSVTQRNDASNQK